MQHVSNKASVNLDHTDPQIFEIGQGGIAGTKIVKRKANPDFAAILNDARYAYQVFQRARLKHFKLQVTSARAGMSRQNGAQSFDKIDPLQLPGTDIDTDLNIEPINLPPRTLRQCFANDPFADVHRQRMIFNDRQKRQGAALNLVRGAASESMPLRQPLPHYAC